MYAMSNLTVSISEMVSRCSSSVSPQNPAMKSDDRDTSTGRREGEEREGDTEEGEGYRGWG